MFLAGMGFESNHDRLAGSSPLPLDVGYLLLVGPNILLLMVLQQQLVILEFSQEKMSSCPLLYPLVNKCHKL